VPKPESFTDSPELKQLEISAKTLSVRRAASVQDSLALDLFLYSPLLLNSRFNPQFASLISSFHSPRMFEPNGHVAIVIMMLLGLGRVPPSRKDLVFNGFG
jgi:hypothetical protein